ncbi:E3 ubiquitin-protein ligase TRIM39-like [Pristis pectinata]|uniref:E3 ubiquitin-protein ligase TRIM39-like n=1 Tax=Pristis pectinata TaxID=685728 RepID=UPI00223CFBF5|nr:E3 ubiquitin-protein ligase TRIM39-like [Pristis pectinata]
MAELEGLIEELTCPICLEIFVDPVSLQCGHHFCGPCISQALEQTTGRNACPQCRQVFTEINARPARRLSIIVEQARLLNEKLTRQRWEPCCQEHGEKLKLFCFRELEVICVDCWNARHQSHEVIPVKKAALLYKKELKEALVLLEGKLQVVTEKKMKEEAKIGTVRAEVGQLSEAIGREFAKMHKFLNEREEAMRCRLREKEENVLMRLDEVLAVINNDMSTLEERILEIKSRLDISEAAEVLKDAEDFLTTCDVQCQEVEEFATELTSKVFSEPIQFFNVWRDMRRIIEPNRAYLSLDPETANGQLFVSQDLLSVKLDDEKLDEEQDLFDPPARFKRSLCVLSSQGFTSGRHYWEVGLGNKTDWVIGICKESVNREIAFLAVPSRGYWVMSLFNDNYYRAVSITSTPIPIERKLCKLGIYLDFEGGKVSFYNADDMSHLYTFSDKFTEKLYPIFCPCDNLTGKNYEPLTLLTV